MKALHLIASLLLLSACSKKVVDTSGLLGKSYFPLQSGKFVVYEVDSTVFTEIPRDTLHYTFQIKEKIADTYLDSEGHDSIRLERYIKRFDANVPFSQQAWTIKEVYLIRADDRQIEQQEDNTRFVKLIFPVEEKASWDGNAANTLGRQDYLYDSIEQAEVINNLRLDKVLKVKQLQKINLIEAEIESEKYAKDIGLVFKEHTHVKGNTVTAGKTVFQRIEGGYIYQQKILTHGTE